MNEESDENCDVQLQMSSAEFQEEVQNAARGAILDILVFLLGLLLTFMFVLSGFQMIVSTPGIAWNIFGILNIAVGVSVFWWAVLN